MFDAWMGISTLHHGNRRSRKGSCSRFSSSSSSCFLFDEWEENVIQFLLTNRTHGIWIFVLPHFLPVFARFSPFCRSTHITFLYLKELRCVLGYQKLAGNFVFFFFSGQLMRLVWRLALNRFFLYAWNNSSLIAKTLWRISYLTFRGRCVIHICVCISFNLQLLV